MCTQRPFTSQVISKIYFLTFASYIEKLPEITLNKMSIKVIFISGNIGAGKETMLQYLDESLTNRNIKVKTILEPVELWRESGMLRRLYNGEYLEFQKYAITSRIDTMNAKYQEAINENCKLVLVETNPFCRSICLF